MGTRNYKKTHRHNNTKQYSNTINAPSLQVADNNGHHVTSLTHEQWKTRTALFWALTQPVVVIPLRRFGTTYRHHL
jgi:hypothetical protein